MAVKKRLSKEEADTEFLAHINAIGSAFLTAGGKDARVVLSLVIATTDIYKQLERKPAHLKRIRSIKYAFSEDIKAYKKAIRSKIKEHKKEIKEKKNAN